MGLLDLLFGGSSRRNSQFRAEMRRLREPKSKYYRLAQALSWTLIALAAVILLLGLIPAFTPLHENQNIVLRAALIGIAVGVGGLAALPWINFVERAKRQQARGRTVPSYYKWLALCFFILIGACIALWIIAVFVVHLETFARLIEKTGEAATGEQGDLHGGDGALTFLAVSVVLSLQVVVATWIATSILYYKKKYMTIRIISYISGILTDIWASWVVAGFLTGHLYREDGALMIPLDPSKLILIVGILAVVGLIISNSFRANFVYRERLRMVAAGQTGALTATEEDFLDDSYESTTAVYATPDAKPDETPEPEPEAKPAPKPEPKPKEEKSIEERLARIKELHENGILSDEEFEKKKKELIDQL